MICVVQLVHRHDQRHEDRVAFIFETAQHGVLLVWGKHREGPEPFEEVVQIGDTVADKRPEREVDRTRRVVGGDQSVEERVEDLDPLPGVRLLTAPHHLSDFASKWRWGLVRIKR